MMVVGESVAIVVAYTDALPVALNDLGGFYEKIDIGNSERYVKRYRRCS